MDVSFTYRKKLYSLRCQVLDEEIAYTIPKPLENLTDIDMSSTKVASKKRKQNKSRSRSQSQNNLTSASEAENGSCSEAGPKTSKEQYRTKNDSNKSKSTKIESKKSNENQEKKSLDKSKSNLENFAIESEISIKDLYEFARNGNFPKKIFVFSDCQKSYAERLHFYTSIQKFAQPFKSIKEESLEFKCRLCKHSYHASLGAIQNLTNHLKTHDDFKNKWENLFEQKLNRSPKHDKTNRR